MLHRLSIRDFVIVDAVEIDFGPGLTVLTGETGAGKSILVDALQLALGGRGDAGSVREGASRIEVSAEFDSPPGLAGWLDGNGFAPGADDDASRLLLRRTVDSQGKSRAFVNGGAATVTQLREAAESLVEIHGQHAWQSLTRVAAVRAIVDEHAGIDPLPLTRLWHAWRAAAEALDAARDRQGDLDRERERLAWQIGELDRLAPTPGEWAEIDETHRRLSNAQALIDAAGGALAAVSGGSRGDGGDADAEALVARAVDALQSVAAFDPRLAEVIETLAGAQVQLRDASHTLASYLDGTELDPERLRALDERMSAWHGLARRYRRPPDELPALLAQWRQELQQLDAAADLGILALAVDAAKAGYDTEARRVSAARTRAAPGLAAAVTRQIHALGMTGGAFEIGFEPTPMPQSYGLESAEFRVAGHAGTTPRPLARVASGGELSRIALSIAVARLESPSRGDPHPNPLPQAGEGVGTLIFDEIDAGIGGAVAETVGRLMKQLGRSAQVLAVTHLPQVAACADRHLVVAKTTDAKGGTSSSVGAVSGESRVAEIARMTGGEKLLSTSLAHAQEMLASSAGERSVPARAAARKALR